MILFMPNALHMVFPHQAPSVVELLFKLGYSFIISFQGIQLIAMSAGG
jgi:hypothetical protein